LKADIEKEKDSDTKFELKKKLSLMMSRLRSREQKEKREVAKRDWKKKELKLVEQGKKPFYMKKCKL
jgi:ribosomal RNA-processing protein 36